MAKPIKKTPILTGRDAENFYKEMSEAEKKHISDREAKSIKSQANKIRNLYK